jgi:hypothetical protein
MRHFILLRHCGVAATLIVLTSVMLNDAAAQRRGGGGGGGRVGGGGGVSHANVGSANLNRSGNVNHNVNRSANVNQNVNVNRNVNVDVDRGWGGVYRPVGAAVAVGAGVALTAAAIGSIAYSIPPSCVSTTYYGAVYQQCGSTWYQPQYAGTQVSYVVVNPPY